MNFTKRIMTALVFSSFASTLTLGMQGDEGATFTPLTPRTSAFRAFTAAVADEKYDATFSTQDGKKTLVIKNPSNGDTILGQFSSDTKLTEALSFIREVSEGSEAHPVTMDENLGAGFVRLVRHEIKEWYFVATFTADEGTTPLESPQESAEISPEVVAEKQPNQDDQLNVLAKRLTAFVEKAGRDAHRLATCGEAKKVEKEVRRVRDNTKKFLKKLF